MGAGRSQPKVATSIDPPRGRFDRLDLYLALFILAAILCLYGRTFQYGFVNYDDPVYVTENPHVLPGLTPAGLAWAATSTYAANWHPLTWLSHMLDCQFFGARGGPHHAVNVLLHALSSLLLFGVLRRATGARWRSAAVAFLFAIHPLHVESVAWVAERKDVLSACFWFLTIWRYLSYVEKRTPVRYGLVLLSFSLGLMAKPTTVTLPLALLLLDAWPLGRLNIKGLTARADGLPSTPAGLLWEKAPLFLMSAGASLITVLAQRGGGAVGGLGAFPLASRIGNAALAYCQYVAAFFAPVHLAVFYPFPSVLYIPYVAAACLLILAVSIWLFRNAVGRPYLAVGFLWYFVTLLPMIGLVQVGSQARADRYMYLPLVGLAIALVWGAEELTRERPQYKSPVVAALVVLCVIWSGAAWAQVSYWSNSDALFRHALEVTDENYVASNGLGLALKDSGRPGEAVALFQSAIRVRPDFAEAHNNLGSSYADREQWNLAVPEFQEALRLNPQLAGARLNLATAMWDLGRFREAADQYTEAVRLMPGDPGAESQLGRALAAAGRSDEALAHLSRVIRLSPGYAGGHFNLGYVLAGLGRFDEAIPELQEAIRIEPGNAQAYYNLGVALANRQRFPEALAAFRSAVQLKPGDARAQAALGSALAATGQPEEGIPHLVEALRLDPGLEEARANLETARSLLQSGRERP